MYLIMLHMIEDTSYREWKEKVSRIFELTDDHYDALFDNMIKLHKELLPEFHPYFFCFLDKDYCFK